MTTHSIKRDGFALSVTETGSGPPVLFAHSLTFDHAMWSAQVEALSPRHRCLQLDLHGHGTSGAPDRVFTLEEMADDITNVLDALDVERIAYVGHSLGGMVGQRLALRHPHRIGALALFNTSGQAEGPMRDEFHRINEKSRGKPPNEATVQFILQLMFSTEFRKAQPDRVKPFHDLLFNAPDAEGAYRVGHAVIWRTNLLDQLGQLDVPTLVVTSQDDSATLPDHGEAIAQAIPAAQYVSLPGGHLSPVEQAPRVTELLDTFLEQTWRTA